MKIQGPNHTNFNPYQKQLQKQAQISKETNKEDQLQISDQAKKLQEKDQPEAARKAHVDEIKQAVQSGNYRVDAKETAEKMINFWNKQS
ncbi:flagellar biosynthesis anti-sigma factor FlgM [Aquibacillus albus]|uniref:Negative regulator of flagellin synthesis n=1 Tax=Aquibacillus albus TaxID=1168171 RepID=A0ABS2MWV4_9BACI|nr:flagellar biosynthesis anti-sigma factor FlgM [Aquibacillus albus]MBM7570248.1 negative regulator of flagellin synthesis FlgM [Aquibacillus albus]